MPRKILYILNNIMILCLFYTKGIRIYYSFLEIRLLRYLTKIFYLTYHFVKLLVLR